MYQAKAQMESEYCSVSNVKAEARVPILWHEIEMCTHSIMLVSIDCSLKFLLSESKETSTYLVVTSSPYILVAPHVQVTRIH